LASHGAFLRKHHADIFVLQQEECANSSDGMKIHLNNGLKPCPRTKIIEQD
jgi:hypothetical protein